MNMHLWSTDIQPVHYPIIDNLKEIGYDGIEFFLGSESRKSYEQLGEYTSGLGLKLMSVVGAEPEVNAVSPDIATRKSAKLWIKERIDDVAAAGGSNLGGPFHSVFNHFTGLPVTEDEICYSVEFLQEAGEYAKEKNITLTPEFLNRYETYFGNTMAQLHSLLSQVDHPNVLGMFDTYHANIEEKSQEEAIRAIAPYLSHVHISENDRGAPGSGHIDFDSVFKTLKEVNFSGSIAIEAFNRENEIFANAVKVWREFSPVEEIVNDGYNLIKKALS
ncbi:sugar phosphate isomerase/epimerase [Akkermansiaceae bacterium]|nr:sugar phosphate isomerase/epimerase [Akkermansiaceae bacterium]